MSDPYEIIDLAPVQGPPLTLPDRLRARACPAGEPHTGDDPASDHGHTDCWLFHRAAAEIERLRDAMTEAIALLDKSSDTPAYHAWVDLIAALEGTTDDR